MSPGLTTVSNDRLASDVQTEEARLQPGDPAASPIDPDATLAGTASGDLDAPRRPSLEPAAIPERIGRYIVHERLGAGGMGVVFSAYDPQLERTLAIKLLHDERRGEQTRLRLLREAQALARVSHRNVVQVYDVGAVDERVYIVMEHVSGVSLRRWLDEEPRPLPDLMRVFAEAGQGLAAAHREGIVHRDFKPDNVLVAADGRVAVLDFGIAHAIEGDPHDLDANDDDRDDQSSAPSALATDLTEAGSILGTPAYMAPEQFESEPVDPRTDQFSFCVALWEAIHGERPYPGDSPMEIWEALRNAQMRAPSARSVPRALQLALTKGLQIDPAQRFANMDPLLALLERDPRSTRRRIVLGVLVAGSLAFGMQGMVGTESSTSPACDDGRDQLATTWGPEARTAVKNAFGSIDRPMAHKLLPFMLDRMDDYGDQWAQLYDDACADTHIRGTQSTELLDLRIACLEERRIHLSAIAEALAGVEADRLEPSSQLVLELRPLEVCNNVEILKERVPPPDDPEVAREVARQQRQLARAETLRRIGDYEQSLSIARQVMTDAESVDYVPAKVDAMLELARNLSEHSMYPESLQAFEDGFYLALTVDDERAIEAALDLMDYYDFRKEGLDESGRWERMASALLERRGLSTGELRMEFEYNNALLRWDRGDYPQALESYERAVAEAQSIDNRLFEWRSRKGVGTTLAALGRLQDSAEVLEQLVETMQSVFGPDYPGIASVLNNLAATYIRLGHPEQAIPRFERSLALREALHGPHHLLVANSLNNLAVTYSQQGQIDKALDYYARVLEIYEVLGETDTADYASALSNLGWALYRLDRFSSSLKHQQRALPIRERVLGAEHPDTLNSVYGIGLVKFKLKQSDEGTTILRDLVTRARRSLGEQHLDTARYEQALGIQLIDQGQSDRAVPLLEHAAQNQRAVLPADHPRIHQTSVYLAMALFNVGQPERAAEVLDRTSADIESRAADQPTNAALAHFVRAQIELGRGDQTSARASARTALERLDAPGARKKSARWRKTIEHWIEANVPS